MGRKSGETAHNGQRITSSPKGKYYPYLLLIKEWESQALKPVHAKIIFFSLWALQNFLPLAYFKTTYNYLGYIYLFLLLLEMCPK